MTDWWFFRTKSLRLSVLPRPDIKVFIPCSPYCPLLVGKGFAVLSEGAQVSFLFQFYLFSSFNLLMPLGWTGAHVSSGLDLLSASITAHSTVEAGIQTSRPHRSVIRFSLSHKWHESWVLTRIAVREQVCVCVFWRGQQGVGPLGSRFRDLNHPHLQCRNSVAPPYCQWVHSVSVITHTYPNTGVIYNQGWGVCVGEVGERVGGVRGKAACPCWAYFGRSSFQSVKMTVF